VKFPKGYCEYGLISIEKESLLNLLVAPWIRKKFKSLPKLLVVLLIPACIPIFVDFHIIFLTPSIFSASYLWVDRIIRIWSSLGDIVWSMFSSIIIFHPRFAVQKSTTTTQFMGFPYFPDGGQQFERVSNFFLMINSLNNF
jgi:hypothetical protein